jgi:peptidylprolyl isomerase
VLKAGNGPVVEDGDTVVVQYTGVLWDDNSVFDSSWDKGTSGAPATFTVSTGEDAQVIPGFSKAIIGQKVGSQLGVIIPPSEGYGEAGAGQTIPGNATLFFVVDILGVV